MARVCEICKKGVLSGRHVRHKASGNWQLKAQRKVRKIRPNLRNLHVFTEVGTPENIKVCMKCYKRIRS